jgi:CTP:molybdopterin cytidylyltransferase MocA
VEELHWELAQCMDINQKMQHSMRNLLERTDNLKRDIVAILEIKMPATSFDTLKSERRSSSEFGTELPDLID